ncbi:MAG: BON domain-containing protein, partial [Alphaproteobacteria bacterium]
MSNDAHLKDSVLAELQWTPTVNAAHIGVAAHDGVITLTGHVETYAEKHAAEVAVRSVKGVRAIAEEIEVKLAFDVKRSDEEIAAAVLMRMAWDSTLPKNAVKATVQNGWVTLTGDVDWGYQHEAAGHEVQKLWGVVGVSNNIKVNPRVDTQSISSDIQHALHRSWFDPQHIRVTA